MPRHPKLFRDPAAAGLGFVSEPVVRGNLPATTSEVPQRLGYKHFGDVQCSCIRPAAMRLYDSLNIWLRATKDSIRCSTENPFKARRVAIASVRQIGKAVSAPLAQTLCAVASS